MMTETLDPSQLSSPSQTDDVVLSVKGVSKKFCRSLKRSLWYGVQDLAGELFGSDRERDTLRKEEFWALKDISFELRRGEALGLVGANGAGKTTLLRIISGLIKPDEGEIEINGRIAPLIALGAGFNPILTGRENIYANMSILGLTKPEIDDRFEDVVEFAEIGEALDAPVQSYSSGMAARLGFACAIHVEPDILLIDEVLAVGDMRFRAKCYRHLAMLRKQCSFILVSHDSNAILAVSSTAMYLSKGQLITLGEPKEVVRIYEHQLFSDKKDSIKQAIDNNSTGINHSDPLAIAKILSIDLSNIDKQETNNICSGLPTVLKIKIEVNQFLEELRAEILIYDRSNMNQRILRLSSYTDNTLFTLDKGIHEIQLVFPLLCLKPGFYNSKIYISLESLYILDIVEHYQFQIEGNPSYNTVDSLYFQPRQWILSQNTS